MTNCKTAPETILNMGEVIPKIEGNEYSGLKRKMNSYCIWLSLGNTNNIHSNSRQSGKCERSLKSLLTYVSNRKKGFLLNFLMLVREKHKRNYLQSI